MENKDPLYGIYLPNPDRPAHHPSPLLYVGTEDDIFKFVDKLDALRPPISGNLSTQFATSITTRKQSTRCPAIQFGL